MSLRSSLYSFPARCLAPCCFCGRWARPRAPSIIRFSCTPHPCSIRTPSLLAGWRPPGRSPRERHRRRSRRGGPLRRPVRGPLCCVRLTSLFFARAPHPGARRSLPGNAGRPSGVTAPPSALPSRHPCGTRVRTRSRARGPRECRERRRRAVHLLASHSSTAPAPGCLDNIVVPLHRPGHLWRSPGGGWRRLAAMPLWCDGSANRSGTSG